MSDPLRFEIVEPDEWTALAPAWASLLAASASDTIFLTPEWLTAWWSAYAAGRESALIAARRGGDLAGLFPLQVAPERYRGLFGLRALRFLGDGTYDSDYLDLIVPRGGEEATVRAFWAWLRGSPAPFRYHVARLNEIPIASPHFAMLRELAGREGALLEEERVGCVETALPGSWDAYVASLKPRMRTKIRSLRRDLEARHAVTLERCADESALEETLASLFRLHERRWATRGEAGVFRGAEKRAFYHAAGRALLARGWLELYTLRADGRPVAHQFCAGYKGTVSLLQEGYDPDWETQGVGNVLRAMIFERLIGEGWQRYDFLGGVTSHKLSWGGAVKESARLTIRGGGARGALVAGATKIAAASAPLRARWKRRSA